MSIKEIVSLFVNIETSIKEVMDVIDKGSRGIALVTDEEHRLMGTITDGDIRRAILKGISLDTFVKEIMNEHFIFVSQNYTKLLIDTIFQKKGIFQIPVLDDNMRVVDIVFYNEFYKKPTNENWAVVMAGGLGSRLAPLTNEMPKPMLNVGAKPILETIIEQLKSYGYRNIILSLNYKADIIENYFQDGSNFGVEIKYVKENKRLGTAGAIKLAEKYLDKPFFVLNGDILTKLNFNQFMQFHTDNKNIITIGTKKYDVQIPYGVVDIKDASVEKLVEKPIMGFFINAGMYVLEPKVVELIPENEYFDMPQLINAYISNNGKVGSFPITEYWMDIGHMNDYYQANTDYYNNFGGEVSATKG